MNVQIVCTQNFDMLSHSRDCYFQFLKIDVCHIGILLPVLILTCSSSWVQHFISAYQISSKSVNTQQSYVVILIFQDAG